VPPAAAPPPVTVTAALPVAVPPAPVQLSVKLLLVAVNAPVFALPEVARLPLQAPLATQLDASVEDHVSVELLPLVTDVGFAEMFSVGALTTVLTATVVASVVVPPAPVQASAKVLLGLVSAPVLTLPEVERGPLHAPLAVQFVALVDDQLIVALPPVSTLVGLAEIDTVGADGGGTFTATFAL